MKNSFLLVVYLLVPLAWDFTKRWTPSQIICKSIKVFDLKSRKLFCRTRFSGCSLLVKRPNLLGKQNISLQTFASKCLKRRLKKPFASKLCQLHNSHLLNWNLPWRKEKNNSESKYHDRKVKSLKWWLTLVCIFSFVEKRKN